MQQDNQYTKVMDLLDNKLKQAKKQLDDVRFYYENGHVEHALEQAFDVEATVEKAVILSRNLPAYTGHPQALQKVEEIIRDTVPVEIGFTKEGWFSVRIPLLLPKKNSGSTDYIRGFLYPRLSEFFRGKQPVRYTDCVVIYRHVYDRQRPERQYRDHDNYEINFVTDAVAMYVMPDDNPTVCTHYYCSAKSSTERTEVYVVPKKDFKQWFDEEQNMPDKGVELYADMA